MTFEDWYKKSDCELTGVSIGIARCIFQVGAKEMRKENDQLKEKIKKVREKLFNILSEYEIGNYDTNIHQFYKDVYDIHNELMEFTE